MSNWDISSAKLENFIGTVYVQGSAGIDNSVRLAINGTGDLVYQKYDLGTDTWTEETVSLSVESIRKIDTVQTTGLLNGGVISATIPGTTVDWTAGVGQVADYADPENPVVTEVTWPAVSGYTPTNLATDATTLLGYDKDGNIVETLAYALTAADTKANIYFGSVTHVSSIIVSLNTSPGNLAYDRIGAFKDFFNLVIGPANVNGNIYGPNGANLNIDVIGGTSYMLGSNFRNDPGVADLVDLPSIAGVTFYRLYREADPSLTMAYAGPTILVDPTQYDDGSGTLQAVTAGYWTIQRIFRGRTGQTFVAYGQQEFSTKALALEALGQEPFEEKMPLPLTLYRCSLVVAQNATDLSDTNQAEFFAQSSFRITGAVSSSATIPGVTSPGGVDRSIQYNNAGNFGGSSNFTFTIPSNYATLKLESLGIAGGASVVFNNSSSSERLKIAYEEGTNLSVIEATSNNLLVVTNSTVTFEYGVSSLTLVDITGDNNLSLINSAIDKNTIFNIKNNALSTKFDLTYNQTLENVFVRTDNSAKLYLISAANLTINSNEDMSIEALGDYNVYLLNDQATLNIGSSTSNYVFSFANTLDNTTPLILFSKSGTSGGNFRLYTSTVTPEGAITAFGGDICVVSFGASSDMYIKLSDTGNTGWQKLLHGASGVQGPVTSTDNAISTWNGIDGLTLNDSNAFIVPSGANTSLFVDVATTGGNAEIGLRNDASTTRYLIQYNQGVNLVTQSTFNGAQHLILSAGKLNLEANDIITMAALGNYNVIIKNDDSIFAIANAAGGHSFSLSNSEPNTEPLMIWAKDHITGGVSGVFVSNTTPEGVITANGGYLCLVSDDTNSNVFIKLENATNTNWKALLHEGNGVQGPATSTNNAIATWNGTDGLTLNNTYAFVVSDTNNTVLLIDNVTATGQSGLKIRNNAQNERMSITYNQVLEDIIHTTSFGVDYYLVPLGNLNMTAEDAVVLASSTDQTITISNIGASLILYNSPNGDRLFFTNATNDTIPMLQFDKTGLNGGSSQIFFSSRSPEGIFTGTGGDITIRSDSVSSEVYLKRTGTGNTGWNVMTHKTDASATLNAIAVFDSTSGSSITDIDTATLSTTAISTIMDIKPVTSAGSAEINFNTSGSTLKAFLYYSEVNDSFGIEADTTDLFFSNYGGPITFISATANTDIHVINSNPKSSLFTDAGDIAIRVAGTLSDLFLNKGSVSNNNIWAKVVLDSDTNAYGGFGRLQNRVRWSEDLANAVWSDGLGNTTVIPNATIGPNGVDFADNLRWDILGLGLRQGPLGTVNGNTYTVSLWAKKISGTNNLLLVDINDGTSATFYIDSNNWQRYYATVTAGASGSWIDFTHGGTSTFAIWGVQVNDGAELYPYLKREDVALTATTDYGLSVAGKINFTGSVVDSDDIITNLATGVIEGGVLSINGVDDSLINVTAGRALIADYSTAGSPNIREISWAAQTVDPVLGATEFIKWIGVQESTTPGVGQFVFDIEFTQLEKRKIAIVGRCWGDGVTDTITAVGQYTTTATGQAYTANDLSYVLGSMNKRGNVFSANGANLLLDKTAGISYRYSADYLANPTAPHVHADTAQTGIAVYWYLKQNSLVAEVQPDIDPDNWDNGGTKTAVPTGKYTLQRLYYYPVSQLLAPTYGQELFDSMGEAIGKAGEDIVEVPDELLEGAILRGWIALKQGATALNDPAQALFKEARNISDQPAKGTVGSTLTYRNYTVADIGASGIHYYAGFYQAPASSVTLTIGGTVAQVYGTANIARGAHAFCVASGAGGTNLVLTVSGTSITDLGVRTTSDSEIIVPDTDQATLNQYFETTKKWLGQITYTLTGAAGSFTFNYGFAKYDDFGNRNFTITDFQVTGQGAASETALDIQLMHHKFTGWTYSAGAFVPGTGFIVSLANDYSTDDNLANGIGFAYKRTNLSTFVNGEGSEGLLVKFSTATNNSISSATIEVGALI